MDLASKPASPTRASHGPNVQKFPFCARSEILRDFLVWASEARAACKSLGFRRPSGGVSLSNCPISCRQPLGSVDNVPRRSITPALSSSMPPMGSIVIVPRTDVAFSQLSSNQPAIHLSHQVSPGGRTAPWFPAIRGPALPLQALQRSRRCTKLVPFSTSAGRKDMSSPGNPSVNSIRLGANWHESPKGSGLLTSSHASRKYFLNVSAPALHLNSVFWSFTCQWRAYGPWASCPNSTISSQPPTAADSEAISVAPCRPESAAWSIRTRARIATARWNSLRLSSKTFG